MKKVFYIAIAFMALSSCSNTIEEATITPDVFPDGVMKESIVLNGISRDYLLYVPKAYNGRDPLPIVFNFHGENDNADDFLWQTSDMRTIANVTDNEFFIVYPQARICDGKVTWNSSSQAGTKCNDDLSFINALIDSIASKVEINTDKIFAGGYSEGGTFALSLGMSNNRFAAVGSVAGTMSVFDTTTQATPVIFIHGTADSTFPYFGDVDTESIQSQLDFWIKTNNADSTPLTSSETSPYGVTIDRYQYLNGNKVSVEHHKVNDGLHMWNIEQIVYPAGNPDDETGLLLWKFFECHSL